MERRILSFALLFIFISLALVAQDSDGPEVSAQTPTPAACAPLPPPPCKEGVSPGVIQIIPDGASLANKLKLARKRFYLSSCPFNLSASVSVATAPTLRNVYDAAGASSQLISWLEENHCETIYCRALTMSEAKCEGIDPSKCVPEFTAAYRNALSALKGNADLALNMITTYAPLSDPKLRIGFYEVRSEWLKNSVGRIESAVSNDYRIRTTMTDKDGIGFFYDLCPGRNDELALITQEARNMKTFSRRKVISTLAAGGAGLALTEVLGENRVDAEVANAGQITGAVPIARAFRGQHQPKPLPFDPTKLKGISEKLIKSHWENNYGGAVKALNAVEQRLASMLQDKDLPPYVYGDLKREELVRTGSVVLHDHYFANLGGDGKAGGAVLDAIKQWFGSYEQWEAEFKKTGNALGGGSGWVILGYNQHTAEMHNYWAWDHMHNAPMSRPLLVLDMYEHAYHMDYGAAAAKYVDAFMQNVNWEEVNRRAETAMK